MKNVLKVSGFFLGANRVANEIERFAAEAGVDVNVEFEHQILKLTTTIIATVTGEPTGVLFASDLVAATYKNVEGKHLLDDFIELLNVEESMPSAQEVYSAIEELDNTILPLEDRIRIRAYEISQSEADRGPLENWLQAERELS
jgi:hypothetical protein